MDQPDVPHIVAIDDEPDLLLTYRDVFESEGFRVTTINECGTDASSILDLHPSLVILDLRCGEHLGGLELLRRLRARDEGRGLSALICTAMAPMMLDGIADELTALDADVIQKPFDLDDLIDTVRLAVQGTSSGV